MLRKENLAPRVNGSWIGGKRSIPARLERPPSIFIHLSPHQEENQALGKRQPKN
jgi:hypothetical protein